MNKYPHSFTIYHKDLVICSKCLIICWKSRRHAIKGMVSRFTKKFWKTRDITSFKYLSFKHYCSFIHSMHNNNNIVHRMNHKHQTVQKIYCKYSHNDSIIKDIIQ